MQVIDSSIRLSLVQRPSSFRVEVNGDRVSLVASPLQVTAKCDVTGAESELATEARLNPRNAPWKLGFMQLQLMEVQWVYYRGLQSSEGCVLNDFSAKRDTTICRDYDRMSGTPWYEATDNPVDSYGIPDTKKPSPWKLEFYFGDNPKNDFPSAVSNADTQRRNYFYEARLSMGFLTTLTCQSPAGISHLRNFNWSAVWHVRSESDSPQMKGSGFKLLPGSGFWISDFRKGPPTNSKYLLALNNLSLTKSCNEIASSVSIDKQTSGWWQKFPQMTAKDPAF
ncbi:MAG: hypothetical protein FJW36_04545 [Acidobacteria bacterium]|nr:hypothetical protein [Acidobacteriota bacterium]